MEQQDRLIMYARANRRDPTNAAGLLWWRLKARQLGVRFRREDPIGPYIADFSCRTHRLVVEADGDTHTDPDKDCARDAWFLANGWCVLRFTDDEITTGLDDVVEMIYLALDKPFEVMDMVNESKPHRWCTGPHPS